MKNNNTLVVNLFAGPGAGKSTFCANVFAELKWREIDCEMALEYAKDKVWEGSEEILSNQFYVFGKQSHRIHRLLNKVEVVVTDSPLLFSIIYDAQNDKIFRELIYRTHSKHNSLNFFIERAKPYNPKGRMQSEAEAKQLDLQILSMLDDYNVPYKTIVGEKQNAQKIINDIVKQLN